MSGKVTMLESGVRGFANAVKRLAVKDKKFAEELVYMHGIRSEITPNALKGITKDMFDKGGKLTEKGKKEVASLMREFKLPKNATWDDALAAVRAFKEKVAAKLEAIKMPDFNKVAEKISDNIPKFENLKKSLAKYQDVLQSGKIAPIKVAPNSDKLISKSSRFDFLNSNHNKT